MEKNIKKENMYKREFCEGFKFEVISSSELNITNNSGKTREYIYTEGKLCFSPKSNDVLQALRFKFECERLYDTFSNFIYVEFFDNDFHFTDKNGYRTRFKKGRALRKLFDCNDTQLSNMVDYLRQLERGIVEDIEVTEEVGEIYNTYHTRGGSVGSSCMRDCGSYYYDLKRAYGEKLKVAHYTVDGILKARALLWDNVTLNDEPIKFMDRIYYSEELHLNSFKKWAKEKGYYIRYKQGSGVVSDFISPEGEEVEGTLVADTGYHFEDCDMPYMDTFRYLNNGNYLTNNDYKGYDYELDSTEGGGIRESCFCTYCEESVDAHEDDMYYVENLGSICPSCRDEYYVYTEDTNRLVHIDDVITTYEGTCYEDSDYLIYCEDIGEYVHEGSDYYYTVDTERYYYSNSELYYLEEEYEWYEYLEDLEERKRELYPEEEEENV
jgi:hypothetical protein